MCYRFMKMRMSLCMNKALSFRIWVVCILCMSTFCVYAQSDDQLISLGEVKVKSAQVVNKPDGKLIYPSEVQSRHQIQVIVCFKNWDYPIFV